MGIGRWWRVALVLPLAVSACASSGEDPLGSGTTSEAGSTLEIVGASSEIYCDGTDQFVGEIRGADPGERFVLSSPTPIQLSAEQENATADADGTFSLTWRCLPTEVGQPWELRIRGEDSGRQATVSFTGTGTDPDAIDTLQISLDEDTFICDGTTRILGQLSNAASGEPVTFAAERADDLVDGAADAEGRLTLRWQCSPDEAGTWQVTAHGLESDRVGEFTIVGVAPPPGELLTLTVEVVEDPFLCDGGSRAFGTVSGFLPDEAVHFTSPQAEDLNDGRADGTGALQVRWTCGAAEASTVWELTATGAQSGRTITFTLAGAPAPAAPDPTVSLTEDPFRCDGNTRFVATLSGFTPRELVDFTSPQAEDLRQGQADEAGALQVRWTCGAADAGTIWELTATGLTSQRSVSFQITGAEPQG
jgi:hypothetical protein